MIKLWLYILIKFERAACVIMKQLGEANANEGSGLFEDEAIPCIDP